MNKEIIEKNKKKAGRPKLFTLKYCLSEVQKMLKILEKSNTNIILLTQLCHSTGHSRFQFYEWKRQFMHDTEFSNTVKKIEEILETRIWLGAMSKQLNTLVSLFHLKVNYGYKDKEIDIEYQVPIEKYKYNNLWEKIKERIGKESEVN